MTQSDEAGGRAPVAIGQPAALSLPCPGHGGTHRHADHVPVSSRKPDVHLTSADRELELVSRSAVRPLAGALGLMFLVGVPAIVAMLPAGTNTMVAAAAAATVAALMGGAWLILGSRPLPVGSGHAAATAILLLVAGYLMLRGHLHPEFQQTTNFMLLVVGAGALILSTRWYGLAVAASAAAWAFLAVPSWRPDSGPLALGLLNAAILSAVIHVTRVRATLRLIEARTEVAELALQDDLTGLRNRRAFIEIGGEHIALARRLGRPSTILFVDVDGLKQINDRLGHAAGDSALRRVGAALQSSFRDADLIARLGGDEFVVLAPGSGAAVDSALARLTDALASADAAIPGLRLAVSVGRAVIEPHTDEDLSAALQRADTAMYERRVRQVANTTPSTVMS